MINLDEKQKKRLLQLAEVIDDGDIALLKHLHALEDRIDEKTGHLIGPDGHTPTNQELLALITPLIPRVTDGHTPTDRELLDLIKPLVSKEVSDKRILALIKPLIPKINTADIVIEASRIAIDTLKPLVPTPELIQAEVTKFGEGQRPNLEAFVKSEIDKVKPENKIIHGGRASHATKLFPLTPDGSTLIFSVPKSLSAVVFSSDNLPSPLMEGAGFTINATRTLITLTCENAPTLGSQLLYMYQEQFNT